MITTSQTALALHHSIQPLRHQHLLGIGTHSGPLLHPVHQALPHPKLHRKLHQVSYQQPNRIIQKVTLLQLQQQRHQTCHQWNIKIVQAGWMQQHRSLLILLHFHPTKAHRSQQLLSRVLKPSVVSV